MFDGPSQAENVFIRLSNRQRLTRASSLNNSRRIAMRVKDERYQAVDFGRADGRFCLGEIKRVGGRV
jgi:hypothetical protein